MPDWLATLKQYIGWQGATSLADKLTAALAALLDEITALRMAELDPAGIPADVAAVLADTTALLADTLAILTDTVAIEAAVGTEGVTTLHNKLTAARAGYLDSLPNFQQEIEWSATPVVEQVANAAAVNLTAGSITPTFPTGATRVRVILVASIHVANQATNTHHIDLKVQGQKAGGGYGDLLDLTAQTTLGLVNLDGAADGWCGAINVTALVDASGVQYDFRFVVDSDNAGAVNYTTGFTLALIYRI